MALRNLTNLPLRGKVVTPGRGSNAVTAMRETDRYEKDAIKLPFVRFSHAATSVQRGERMKEIPTDPG